MINRKRAGVPVRELRITGGWISETARQLCLNFEEPYLAKARRQLAVEVIRDERTVKYYVEGCDCGDTDLEREPDDDE